jgi:hypothetical protein
VNVNPGFTPSSSTRNAVAAVGDTYIAALDSAGGIHVSTSAGQSWSTIKGTANAVTGGGFAAFVLSSTGVSYHINLVVPTITNTGGGFWACPPAEGCPPGSYHTQYATTYFGGVGGAHGTTGVTTKVSGYPETVLAPVATETGTNCDPFFGDPDQTDACEAYYEGNAACSVMGALNSLSLTSLLPHFGVSETNYAYANQSGGACAYSKSCPVGQTATCGVGTVYKSTPCSPQFLLLIFGYYNNGGGNVCFSLGVRIRSTRGL